jgi:hypothetical protein
LRTRIVTAFRADRIRFMKHDTTDRMFHATASNSS